jgi:hypothetical protein
MGGKGSDFISLDDLKDARDTVIHWPNKVKEIVDGYKNKTTIPHGVQKDGIQNSWDARKHKKGHGWSAEFEIIEGDGINYLAITDRGTHGLTGRVLEPEELEEDLPSHERWGRFENVAFTKDISEGALGSRGRGKFIFVGASYKNTLLYDTLKDDGTYRFGFRTISVTRSPIKAYDEEEGRDKLVEITKGSIKPLSEVGTRVIIVDPDNELISSIESGEFLRYIGETWWEIIKKRGARILVKYSGKEFQAKVPSEFEFPEKDSDEYKVWKVENLELPFSYSAKTKHAELGYSKTDILKLHIVCNKKGPVPKDVRGVSIQRGGMKICTVENRSLPDELSDSIYGYVTLDSDLEKLILEDEGPEHYSFDYKRGALAAGHVKRFIEDEIGKFAKAKLGWKSDAREIRRKQQRNAERRAIIAINRLAKELGFTGIGKGVRKSKDGKRGKNKEVRISMPVFVFPRKDDLRVNYDETLNNISATVVNDADSQMNVRFKMYLRYYDRVIKDYAESDMSVDAEGKSAQMGPFSETFSEEAFPDVGRYTVVARIVSLMDDDKGTILDEKVQSFYLEEDPPSKGLFENCEPIEYPDHAQEQMGEAVPGDRGGYILQYNVKHPAEKAVENTEDELAEYLFRIMAFELCRLDVLQDDSVLFDKRDKENSDDLLKKTLENIGGMLHRYYGLVA